MHYYAYKIVLLFSCTKHKHVQENIKEHTCWLVNFCAPIILLCVMLTLLVVLVFTGSVHVVPTLFVVSSYSYSNNQ